MNIPYKHFKNHQQYDNMEEFVKVHASFCKGTFTTSLNPKTSSTHQKICTKCGSVAFSEIGEYRNTVKIYFKGYIKNEKIGLDRENKQYGNKLFNNHCVACGIFHPSKTQSDLCPTCALGHTEESYTNYDNFAESHTNAVKTWQQGAKWEVGHHEYEQSHYALAMEHTTRAGELTQKATRLLKMSRYITETHDQYTPYDSFMARMNAHAATSQAKFEQARAKVYFKANREEIEHADKVRLAKRFQAEDEKDAAELRYNRMELHGFYHTADRLLMKACIKAARADPLTSRRHMLEFAIYRKRTAPATTAYTQPQTNQATFSACLNPDLRECALSDVKNVPTNAEVIEVTRAKNHILSPSWQVLKAYKHNGDWMQYTAAFMAEMAQPGPIAEMKRIIRKAKDHPVYLACFEKVGHCHRFLLLDWMNRLNATC